jgi:hypothetical protein
VIDGEEFFVVFAHIAQGIDLTGGVHDIAALWFSGNVRDWITATGVTIAGGDQAAYFISVTELGLV